VSSTAARRRPNPTKKQKKPDYGLIVAAIVGCIAGAIILYFVTKSMPTKARSGIIAGLPNSVPIDRNPAHSFESAGDASALAFLPDGSGVLVGDREGLSLYDPATGAKQSRAFDTTKKGVRAVAVAPGGKTVAAALSYTRLVRAVHATNDAVDPAMLRDATGEVGVLAYAPDGARLYGAAGKTLYAWDARDLIEEEPGRVYSTTQDRDRKRLVRSVVLPATVTGIAVAPDGRSVAVAAGREIVLIDAATFKPVRRLKEPNVEAGGVDFSPDGKRLVGTCRYAQEHAAVVWDSVTGAVVARIPALADVMAPSTNLAAYSPDGKRLALAGDGGTVVLVDGATNKPVRILEQGTEKVESIAFSRDGRTLAVGTNRGPVKLWSIGAD